MVSALVAGAFGPYFNALTCLEIASPVSDISGSVFILIFSVTKALTVFPFAFITVAILVLESSLAMSEALLPISSVESSVLPSHGALAMPEPSPHFALVYRASGLVLDPPVLHLGLWIIPSV